MNSIVRIAFFVFGSVSRKNFLGIEMNRFMKFHFCFINSDKFFQNLSHVGISGWLLGKSFKDDQGHTYSIRKITNDSPVRQGRKHIYLKF